MTSSYVKHGFLADVYEPWVGFEGSEWGDAMRALYAAYDRGRDMWSDEQKDQLEAILRDALLLAYEDGWIVEEYPEAFERAASAYGDTHEYWKVRAINFNGTPDFDREAARLPKWMKTTAPSRTEAP